MPHPWNHEPPDVELLASPVGDHAAALRRVCDLARLGGEIFDALILVVGSKFKTE